MTDDIHSCGPHCTRPGCKAAGESLPVVAQIIYKWQWAVRLEWASVMAAHNAKPGRLVRLSDAQAIIDRLTRERDTALAEGKEIRARWNDAENELNASRPDADEVMALADALAEAQSSLDIARAECWRTDAYKARLCAQVVGARSALRAKLEGRK